jgi:hypothetical protein
MTTYSQKPKQWVEIASGPNYEFATTHVLVLKGLLDCPVCSALLLSSFTSPYLLNLALP